MAYAATMACADFSMSAFVVGAAAAPSFMLCETLLQEGTEPHQRGRVFSARDFLMRLAFLVGVTAAGAVARGFGIQAALLLCAACVAAIGILALVRGGRGVRVRS